MAKRNLKWNKGALEKLRNEDPRIAADLKKRAEKIAEAAGGEDMGYKVTELVIEESRTAVSIMATGKAHFHNRKHHSLLRALDAGKD